MKKGQTEWIVFLVVLAIVILIGGVFLVVALSRPYWAELHGKAEYAQAEQNRRITILEADAKKEAAVKLADAEIARARGVAEANRIIGQSLKENEDYLKYLWVTEVAGKDIDKTVVYIPTEANVPILEAKRLQ